MDGKQVSVQVLTSLEDFRNPGSASAPSGNTGGDTGGSTGGSTGGDNNGGGGDDPDDGDAN